MDHHFAYPTVEPIPRQAWQSVRTITARPAERPAPSPWPSRPPASPASE